MTAPLNRSTFPARPAAPVRIVHLGLGAFHRAHQAWFTQQADPAGEWGIASFTGRRPDAAIALAAQDGLYTLIERSGDGDSFEVIQSIVEANDGADVARLCELLVAGSTAIVTLTITEAAYRLAADGTLDAAHPDVASDIELLRGVVAGGNAPATTPIGRLVQGLEARSRSGAGPIAVVSCDNLASNGEAARAAVLGLASIVDAALGAWIDANVSFVSSSIDRITPRTTEAEVDLVAGATGFADASPVVTEPFRDWILSGAFPAGRPAWEAAGAVLVEEIEPFENRKLWLLNGAHSLMAYAGQLRGHTTVAQALADPVCAGWVEEFWDEAEANLPAKGLNIPAYRAALLERFANARISHHLAQIAMDGSAKLRMRAVPVLKAERAQGRSGDAAARMIAAWVAFLRTAHTEHAEIKDPAAAQLSTALELGLGEDLAALLTLLEPAWAQDGDVAAQVAAQLDLLAAAVPSRA
ncbi:mannitol dehydrogenase family protein [Arthrobacter sp. 35W]|uniref:mannitol dehydrogenase family protein n=1 Tax=Arthrobacter sp. 35W TaxID=1132441 RepID=UPI000428CC1F|nr:mannitol dehydrogenase family protein [Arthrobacter sp. 35W]